MRAHAPAARECLMTNDRGRGWRGFLLLKYSQGRGVEKSLARVGGGLRVGGS